MSALIERLRECASEKSKEAWRRLDGGQDLSIGAMLADEAADRIEKLEAALSVIAHFPPSEDNEYINWLRRQASEAVGIKLEAFSNDPIAENEPWDGLPPGERNVPGWHLFRFNEDLATDQNTPLFWTGKGWCVPHTRFEKLPRHIATYYTYLGRLDFVPVETLTHEVRK